MRLSTQSPNELERQLEPAAFGFSKDEGTPFHRNKWRQYRSGRHTPLKTFVTDIDHRCRGSRMEFDHVIWDVLRLGLPAAQHADDWLQRLDPRVQISIWNKPTKLTTAGRTRPLRLDKRTLEMIERRAGLDALACLTILLREAHETGLAEYAHDLSRWLCRMLLLTGAELFSHGVATALYDFYDELILPLASRQGLYRTYAGISFLHLMERFSRALYHIKGVDPWDLTVEQRWTYQQRILEWRYGWDYFYLFNPIEVPMEQGLPPDSPLVRYWNAQNELRIWGADAGLAQPPERRPPTHLMRELIAAKRALKEYQQGGQR